MSKMPILSVVFGLMVAVGAGMYGPDRGGRTAVCAPTSSSSAVAQTVGTSAPVTSELVSGLIRRFQAGLGEALLQPWQTCLKDLSADVGTGWTSTADALKTHGIQVGSGSLAARAVALAQPAVTGRGLPAVEEFQDSLSQMATGVGAGAGGWPRGLVRDADGVGRLGL